MIEQPEVEVLIERNINTVIVLADCKNTRLEKQMFLNRLISIINNEFS